MLFVLMTSMHKQLITSFKLNLFSFFIYCCPHHEQKTICLDIFPL